MKAKQISAELIKEPKPASRHRKPLRYRAAAMAAACLMAVNAFMAPAFADTELTGDIHDQDRQLKERMGISTYSLRSVENPVILGGGGAPYKIQVYNNGRIAVWKNINGQYTQYQYYDAGKSNGAALHYTIGGTGKSYLTDYIMSWFGQYNSNARKFTYDTAAMEKSSDGQSVTSTWETEDGVEVKQTVEYRNNSNTIRRSWTVTNKSGSDITDVRFINGGDTYFAGSDSGYCYYDNLNNMVYIKKDASNGIMGYSGDPSSPADRYYSGSYSVGGKAAAVGNLPSETYNSRVDAGYYLQWNKGTISNGGGWTVSASERFTEKGTIQIINPTPKTAANGSLISYRFSLQNLSDVDVSVKLYVSSINGYPVSIRQTEGIVVQDGVPTVTVPANGSQYVTVDCEIPENAADGENDQITLMAEYMDGSSRKEQSSVTNTVVKTGEPAIVRVTIVEKTDANLKVNVKYKNVADSGSDGKITVKVTILDSEGRPTSLVKSEDADLPGADVDVAEKIFDFDLSALSDGTYYVRAEVEGVADPNDAAVIVKGPNVPDIIGVTGVSVIPSSIAMESGATRNLSFDVTPANATNRTVIWYSDDESIASVDENGVVTANNDGNVTITALAGDGSGAKGKCEVKVQSPPSRMEINPSSKIMVKGDTLDVSAMVVLPFGYEVSEDEIQWQVTDNGSSDSQYISLEKQAVDWSQTDENDDRNYQSAKVTALNPTNPGQPVTVRASIGELYAECQLTVIGVEPTEIEIRDGKGEQVPDDTISIKADGSAEGVMLKVSPDNADLEPSKVIWSTDRPDLMELKSGATELSCSVKAGSLAGNAVLTATIDGTLISDSINISITKDVRGITVLPSDDANPVGIAKGQELALGVRYDPDDATGKDVVWSALSEIDADKYVLSDSGRLTVTNATKDDVGKVITVRAVLKADNSIYDEQQFVIKDKINALAVEGENVLHPGQKSDYKVNYDPNEISDAAKAIEWTVRGDGASIEKIDGDTVTVKISEDAPLGAGAVVITATSKYDGAVSASITVDISKSADIEYTITDASGQAVTPMNGYYNVPVKITADVSPSDGYSIIINGEEKSSITFDADGTHSVMVYAKKSDGTVTAKKTFDIKIDREKPTVEVSGYTDGAWYKDDVTLLITAKDAADGSGINKNSLRAVDGNAAYPLTDTGSDDNVLSAELKVTETKAYAIKALDKAGNEASESISVQIDRVTPEITVDLTDAGGRPASTRPGYDIISKDGVKATVAVTNGDNIASGMAKLQYKLNGTKDGAQTSGAWTDVTEYDSMSHKYVLEIKDQFDGQISFRAVSVAGNESSEDVKSVLIADADMKAPIIRVEGEEPNDSKWFTTTGVALTVEQDGDTAIGVDKITYDMTMPDGTVNSGNKYEGEPVIISEEGTTTIRVRVIDNAGDKSPETTVKVNIDATRPTVDVSVTKTDEPLIRPMMAAYGTIHNRQVKITAVADDPGDYASQIEKVEYMLQEDGATGGEWQAIEKTDEGYIYILDRAFAGSVHVRARDKAGNLSEEAVESILLTDEALEPPAIFLKNENGEVISEEWTTKQVTVKIEAPETQAGSVNLSYKLTGAQNTPDYVPYVQDATVLKIDADGKTVISVKAEDEAGNRSENSASVWLDTKEPNKANITAKEADGGSAVADKAITKKNVEITITPGTDAGVEGTTASGTAKAQYHITCDGEDVSGTDSEWTDTTSARSLILRQEGTYIIKAVTCDKAGNVSEENTLTFTIDKGVPEAPELTISGQAANPDLWHKTDVPVKIQVDSRDAGKISGIEYKVTKDGSTESQTWESTTGEAVTVDVRGEGIYVVKARATGSNGNKSAVAKTTVKIDQTEPNEPAISAVISYKSDGRTAEGIAYISHKGDGLSGVSKVMYQSDGQSWKEYDESKGIALHNDSKVTTDVAIKAKVTDRAGNESAEAQEVIRLKYSELDMNGVRLSPDRDWSNKDVSVSIDAEAMRADNTGVIKGVEYVLTGAQTGSGTTTGSGITSGSAIKVRVTNEGVTTITVFITFVNGTTEYTVESGPMEIRIDKNIDDNKTSASWALDITSRTKKDVTIRVTAVDGLSGIAGIRLPDGSNAAGQTAEYAVSQNGAYNFVIVDRAGNEHVCVAEVANIAEEARALDEEIEAYLESEEYRKLLTVPDDESEYAGYYQQAKEAIKHVKELLTKAEQINSKEVDPAGYVDESQTEGLNSSSELLNDNMAQVKDKVKDSPNTLPDSLAGKSQDEVDAVIHKAEEIKKNADAVLDGEVDSEDRQETFDKLLDKITEEAKSVTDSDIDLSGFEELKKEICEELKVKDKLDSLTDEIKDLTDQLTGHKTADEIQDILNSITEKLDRLEKEAERLPAGEQAQVKDDILGILTDIIEKSEDLPEDIINESAENMLKDLADRQSDIVEGGGLKESIDKKIEDISSPETIDKIKPSDTLKDNLGSIIDSLKDAIKDIEKLPSNMRQEKYEEIYDAAKDICDAVSKLPDVVQTVVSQEKDKLESILKDVADKSGKSDELEAEKEASKVLDKIGEEDLPAIDAVNKADRDKIEELLKDVEDVLGSHGSDMTEATKNELESVKDELKSLLDKIDAIEQEAEKKAADVLSKADKDNLPTVDTVKKTDEDRLQGLLNDVNNVLTDCGSDLTEATKNELESVKDELKNLLDKIDAIEQEAEKKAADALSKADKDNLPTVDTVKKTDKDRLQGLLNDVNSVLTSCGSDLTEATKNELESVKAQLQSLLNKIASMSGGSGSGSGGGGGGGSSLAAETTGTGSESISNSIRDLIDKLDVMDLTFANKETIQKIMAEFDKLTEKEKAQVENYQDLMQYADKLEELTDRLSTANSMFVNAKDAKGYVTGFDDGTMRPDNNMTRAEAATMLYRLLRQAGIIREKTFSDTDMWAGDYIEQLAALDILGGYGDGTFRPGNNVTRAEFITMLAKGLGIQPVDVNDKFADIGGHWAAGYINGFNILGYTNGYPDGTFRPDEQITRAEAIVLINRVIGLDDSGMTEANQTFSDLPTDHWAYKEIMAAVAR